MEISKADQIALDDALVAPANRLKIGKCNLRLSSDVTSKEATLQVVYDVLKLTPFYKAFQVSADVPEIYMQEFWASAYIHNRSVRFKMNNKKHILNLDQFRDILQICPKVGNEKFEEPPLEKEILAFLASLGHSGEIRKITDVNVNKLHQPWRSFAAIINKCLSGKTSYDSLRLSQAQFLWGMYNNKKVDYAYLLWEDFIYQIENKNTKKGNAMYYPRFTKLVVNFVMAKDPSIPRRNKVNWHYARDDPMFTTINVISRNEDTQLYGTILPAETTTTAGKTTTDIFEAPAHQEFETRVHAEQTEEEVHPLPDWFQQPKQLPSSDHAWNKSVPAVHESVQPWLSNLARRQDPRDSFDELTDTTFDFLAFVINRLNVTTLTPKLLAGPTFELMKGTCKSLTELEYFCEEPLPLIPNSQGRHVIPFHHFINNDLEYLRGGESSRKYSTSVTKTKAADYGQIKWIEDLVPNSIWSQEIVSYDEFALWGISHWGKKRRQFYAFATTRESARDVYSKRRIIAVTKVEIVEWQNYKHLDWITVRRDDDILYKFKEGDFHRLRIQDIEDMLLLLVQGKLTNLNVEERLAFNVSLRMFTRSVVIQRRVEDLKLGVESYQKKLNLIKPDMYRSNLRRRDAYTPYSDPRGFIYENKDKKNRLMRIDELHKFSDGTLDDVRTALNDRLKGIRMEYLPQTFWSQRDKANARAMIQAIDKRLKTRRIMRSLERFVGGRPYGGDLRLLQRTI
ncbi:hypothetical protein Tco_0017762 [Tanacetum coccineum]